MQDATLPELAKRNMNDDQGTSFTGVENEIDELVLEFGVRFIGFIEYNGANYLKFEFRDRSNVDVTDINEVARKINALLTTAPSQTVRDFAARASGYMF